MVSFITSENLLDWVQCVKIKQTPNSAGFPKLAYQFNSWNFLEFVSWDFRGGFCWHNFYCKFRSTQHPIVRIVESVLVESPSTGWKFAFPLFILCVMFFASGAIVIVVEWLQGRIHLLTEENTQFARDIYRRDRQEKLDTLTPESKQIKLTTDVPESEKPKRIDIK